MEKPLSEDYSLIYDYEYQTEQDVLFCDEKRKEEAVDFIKSGHTLPSNFTIDSLCEKEVDKFRNEVRINTFRSRTFAFPHKHPIDLLYISKSEGERFYVLYTGLYWMYPGCSSLVLNINENTNIILQTSDKDVFLGKTYEELLFWEDVEKKRIEYRSYLPISKEDFLKCCYAEHLSIRVSHDNSAIDYEEECDELIPCFQMLFDQTSDNKLFEKNREEWMQAFKKSTEEQTDNLYKAAQRKEQKRRDDNNKMLIYILLFILAAALGGALPFLLR